MTTEEFMQKYVEELVKDRVMDLRDNFIGNFYNSGLVAAKGYGYKIVRDSTQSKKYFVLVKNRVYQTDIGKEG